MYMDRKPYWNDFCVTTDGESLNVYINGEKFEREIFHQGKKET